jgi:transposase
MPRFVEGEPRTQATLFPERIEDYIDEDNPVRAIEAFVDALDLVQLGFHGMNPKATGRPAYHPSTMLKLYIYGYLNRIQTTRRLEREAGRNIEMMWLLGRLRPDFKTIANFRRSNGKAIRKVCAEFVGLCRKLDLFSRALVAIDGSKFKAANNRDKNFTPAKLKRRVEAIESSIDRYLCRLDRVDDAEPDAQLQSGKLQDKIASLKEEVKRLRALESEVLAAPDKQLSITDPDARSMRSRGTGIVGYNVQTAVDAEHHLIVAHEVTNQNNDRDFLSPMATQARVEMGVEDLEVVADRGYYKSQEIKASEDTGVTVYVPKSHTSNNKARGLFDKSDFRYLPETDEYRCPAGERLPKRTTMAENGKKMFRYWSSNCESCRLKSQCTTGKERRVSRWEHEEILERVERRLARDPGKMRIRCQTLKHVSTEMSLHVLAYNMKRAMNILGVASLIEAIRALLQAIICLLRPSYTVRGLG